MRSLLLATLACFIAFDLHSQDVFPSEPFEKPCDEQMANHLALQARTLEQAHAILRNCRNPHDLYVGVTRTGNKETVPLLLERYRLDYGTTEPVLPPGMSEGFVCTRVHLIDALRTITNTDQGLYYPRWAGWWEANKRLSQHQWMLNGFAAQGLHVSEPIDERFALELMEVVGRGVNYHGGPGFDYRSVNAERLLAVQKAGPRARWVERAAASPQRLHRLAAVAILCEVDTVGHEDVLRRLAADSDAEVSRGALTTLSRRRSSSRCEL